MEWRTEAGSPLALDPRRALIAAHREAHRHPLGQARYVGDDSDHPVAAASEVLQRARHHVEVRLVQGPESLVQEDRVEPGGTLGGECRYLRGERERQRKAGLERLAARQRLD